MAGSYFLNMFWECYRNIFGKIRFKENFDEQKRNKIYFKGY